MVLSRSKIVDYEMDEDRRKWIIVIVLVILLILFLIFGPSYYETLTIDGKRVFWLVFQIVFLYTVGSLVLRWLEGRHEVKDVDRVASR